jgi:hypothetical protein
MLILTAIRDLTNINAKISNNINQLTEICYKVHYRTYMILLIYSHDLCTYIIHNTNITTPIGHQLDREK